MNTSFKILVDDTTGKIVSPIYPANDLRPEPPNETWITIQEGTLPYKAYISNEDISNIDLQNSYWDFSNSVWVEVPSPRTSISKATAVFARDARLIASDKVFENLTDTTEINAWIDYRQKLRTLFDNLPDNYNWNELVYPKSPDDIKALKEKALNGDEEAKLIIAKENL